MSLKFLLRHGPRRALALVASEYALIFHASFRGFDSDSQAKRGGPKVLVQKCIVTFSALKEVDLSDYITVKPSGIYGTLGLININADVFLCLITGAVRVALIRPGESVQAISSVEFFCVNRDDYDINFRSQGYSDLYHDNATKLDNEDRSHGSNVADAASAHPCIELKKLLCGKDTDKKSSGSFYFSVDCDLTTRLQNRVSEKPAFDIGNLDQTFLWNAYMIDPLVDFRSRLSEEVKASLDASHILTPAIRGFLSTITLPASISPVKQGVGHLPSLLTLISRLSCKRAGTRFNSRGIDDYGNVANWVETEIVLWHPSGLCMSYAQTRGSLPVFWEQGTGLLPTQQKIQITRSSEATQPAFDKHFETLTIEYGMVHILNLLSEEKAGEADLTARYHYHVRHSPMKQNLQMGTMTGDRLRESHFDVHAATRGPDGFEAANLVRHLIARDEFGYFLCQDTPQQDGNSSFLASASSVILQQEGIFRINCLDCLDRTNLISTIVSQMAIERFLQQRDEKASADFWTRHSSLWADNGDALSKIYAGTGAIRSSFTRHGRASLAGTIADARKSVTLLVSCQISKENWADRLLRKRVYINNFADTGRQTTIDMLLGRLVDQTPVELYDPITDYVNAELTKRANEYTSCGILNIWVGTFNLNGKGNGAKEDLAAWLCPAINQQHPDVVAVGFQEIVELSPQQIMSTDATRRVKWEQAVLHTLNNDIQKRSQDDFVLLRSGQLVGAALMVFARLRVLNKIKDVEGSVKKTGLSGMAGNKGAVAIRLDYADTRFCFVTAHFAAGFANYEDRNRDYNTINHGIRLRGRRIEDHDTIIWLGDFNYRIGLSDDKVRQLISIGDIQTLYQNDQLHLQMVAGNVFKFFSEGKVTFMPTYKYDNGTDRYDSSEKPRIPAWCDRILSKGDMRQVMYNTAPTRFSDHKPVSAAFACVISDADNLKKSSLRHMLYNDRKSSFAARKATSQIPFGDEDLLEFDTTVLEASPASSDRSKWWLDGGQPARSQLQAPNSLAVINKSRPLNPFVPTEEPDWICLKGSINTQQLHRRSHRSLLPGAPPQPSAKPMQFRPPSQTSQDSFNVASEVLPLKPQKSLMVSRSGNKGFKELDDLRIGSGTRMDLPVQQRQSPGSGDYQSANLMDRDNEDAVAIVSLQPEQPSQSTYPAV